MSVTRILDSFVHGKKETKQVYSIYILVPVDFINLFVDQKCNLG